jgi:hypothetical protein
MVSFKSSIFGKYVFLISLCSGICVQYTK